MKQQVLQPRKTVPMPKRMLQKTLRECRANALDVIKGDAIYFVYADEDLVLRALNGQRNYLVTYNTELFEPDTNEVVA
jgi:hypothetical protein